MCWNAMKIIFFFIEKKETHTLFWSSQMYFFLWIYSSKKKNWKTRLNGERGKNIKIFQLISFIFAAVGYYCWLVSSRFLFAVFFSRHHFLSHFLLLNIFLFHVLRNLNKFHRGKAKKKCFYCQTFLLIDHWSMHLVLDFFHGKVMVKVFCTSNTYSIMWIDHSIGLKIKI